MSLNSNQRLSFLLLLLAFTVPALSVAPLGWDGWQGTGNMSESNMTQINTAITNNPIISTTTDAQIDTIAQTISTRLNGLWDPAWNIAIVKSPTGHNTVLYGYAFRDHWMWINGVAIQGDTTMFLSYILWKDYNCQTWSTVTNLVSLTTTFTTEQNSAFSGYSFENVQNDVWAIAMGFVNYFQANAALSTGAYSILMSTYFNSNFRGYFCVFNRNFKKRTYLYSPNGPSGMVNRGSYFLFQTR